MSADEARRYREIAELLLELAERLPAEPSKRLLLSMASDYKDQADDLAATDDVRCRPLVPVPLTDQQVARELEVRARHIRIEQQWSALAAELDMTEGHSIVQMTSDDAPVRHRS